VRIALVPVRQARMMEANQTASWRRKAPRAIDMKWSQTPSEVIALETPGGRALA
jgi:hypothetical protein